jgi:hypothetical protein
MTVAELIEKLRACPQDMQVVTLDQIGDGYFDITISEAWVREGAALHYWTDVSRNSFFGKMAGKLVIVIGR